MAAFLMRWRWVGMFAVLMTAVGCNLQTLSYFLFQQDSGYPPECEELASPKKEIKIVFLINLGSETGPDFIRADREMTDLLIRGLRKRYQETKTKVVIVSPSQVESFKERNPSWQTKSMQEIGKAFHADFVVNIDMDRMSLYKAKTYNEFFQGQAEVTVTVFDLKKPAEEGPVFGPKPFTYTYPRTGPVSVLEGNNPALFRAGFLAYMARELSRCFASYTMDEKYTFD